MSTKGHHTEYRCFKLKNRLRYFPCFQLFFITRKVFCPFRCKSNIFANWKDNTSAAGQPFEKSVVKQAQ